ncbi:MAG: ATP-binding protein [Bacteroidota bacterium]
MPENQHIEWKSNWRDEYLKWICGFANADGGILEIGKDDNGTVVGISNARKLLEDLPNKIKDVLGVLVNVNLHSQDGKHWLSIDVDSYPFPISYKGQFHYRSGSTKQELKGAALNRFLLQKQGRTWDSVPVPNASVVDLNVDTFKYFKEQAVATKRLDQSILAQDHQSLIEQLRLMDGAHLKRSALLLFHPDPEKFFTGAYIKIGYFRDETDLRFQDIVQGNLFEQVDKTVDLLLTKYTEAQVRYQGLSRIEDFTYSEAALREALLNAVAHKDYSSGNPIQIKVYNDRISIWNAGALPPTLTVKRLFEPHPSIPYNPDIALTLFRAGLIESWGRGTIKIIEECKTSGLPSPEFTDEFSGLMVTFYSGVIKGSVKGSVKSSVKSSVKILEMIKAYQDNTKREIDEHIANSDRAPEKQIAKLKNENKIKRIGARRGGHWEVVIDNFIF